MDMSNKTLALLLVAAIVVSLGGTLISLNKINQGVSGYATGAGKVNLTISSTAACSVPYNVSFGSGKATADSAVLSTDSNNGASVGFASASCTTGTTCAGILINNTGNTVLDVNFTSDKNGTTLLTGQRIGAPADTDFKYWIRNGTLGTATSLFPGCLNGMQDAMINVKNGTTAPNLICRQLNYSSTLTAVTIEFNITVEKDLPEGEKAAILTINCV